MEQLSVLLKKLDDRLNCFISLYQSVKEENIHLIEKIDLLESSIIQLQSILEEKRALLDLKNDESLFDAMLIEDLINDLSEICPSALASDKENCNKDSNAHPFNVTAVSEGACI